MTETRYGLPVVRTDRMPDPDIGGEYWIVGAFDPTPAEPNLEQRRAAARRAKKEKRA